ncbi:hypothetical protein SPI_08193 [Niveomyces insectorum RCEF 264]|uniref:Uncharacterized protein n=1 Tax=Niveomyces insectorum RCEF 264 TaxID=1081102 RepID=A0A167NFM9_9HYPO|nr:hypothetical protein SPI_08193 [Niveomyces insectorum RCEF 264]
MSHDTFVDLAGVCVRVLERTITTPATLRIRANLQKLLAHGLNEKVPSSSGRDTPGITNMEIEEDMIAELLQPPLGDSLTSSGTADVVGEHSTATALGSNRRTEPSLDTVQEFPRTVPFGVFDSEAAVAAATGDSPKPPEPTITAQGPLDAFDLDVDSFNGVNFGSWFSGDWATTGYSSM